MKSNNIIYMHVGLGKTGTTTIQYGLRDNVDQLAQMGYLYPRSGRSPEIEDNSVHHNLAFELDKDPRYDPKRGGFRDLIKEIKRSPFSRIILSTECFLPKHAAILHDLLNPLGDVYVLYYIRRQDKWFPSIWAQRVKECGFILSFEEAMQEIFSKTGYYYRGVSAWAKVFGKQNMKVRVLEKDQLFQGDLFQDFLHTCDIEPSDRFRHPRAANPSPSMKILALTRLVRKALQKEDLLHIEIDSGLNVFNLVHEFAEVNRWEYLPPKLVDRELHETIKERYAETNRQLASEYFNRAELFFEQFRDEPPATFNLSESPSEEILELMAYILKRFQNPYT